MKLYTVVEAPDSAPLSIFVVDLGDVKLRNTLGHLRETAVQLGGALAQVSFYIEGFRPSEVLHFQVAEAAWSDWTDEAPPEGVPARIDSLRICANENSVWWEWYDHYTDDSFHARRETRPLPWSTIFPKENE